MRGRIAPGRRRVRPGVAAVELAAVFMFLVLPLMIGVWEVGRLIQVKQLVSGGAREGARLAAQGYTVGTNGVTTEVRGETGPVNVHDAVYRYLVAAGLATLQRDDVTVTFTFLAGRSDGQPSTEPYQGEKNQPFTVLVSVPWDRVRWVNLGLIRPERVEFVVTWYMLTDDAFTVNTTLPT
jgi:Flp pilus assembly protein TadG